MQQIFEVANDVGGTTTSAGTFGQLHILENMFTSLLVSSPRHCWRPRQQLYLDTLITEEWL